MAPIVAGPGGPRLEIGRVIGQSFGIIRKRWATLAVFILGYETISWVFAVFVRPHYQEGRHDAQLALSIALFLGFEILIWLRDTALIATALQTSPAPFASSVASAARTAFRVFPVLAPFFVLEELPRLVETLWRRWSGGALAPGHQADLLLATVFVELAFALTAVAAWGLVAPVAMVEGGGLGAALARAWRLASGSRWRLVAIYVIVTVVGAIPGMLAAALTLPLESSMRHAGSVASTIRIEFGVAGVLSSIVTSTWCVMLGVAYLELRRLREGVAVGDLAEVFA